MFSRITVQLPAQGLLFRRLSGSEALSQSFVLQAELLSTDARIDRKSLLGKPVTFTLPTDGLLSAVNPRYINGKITQIGVRSEELGGVRYAVYGLTVESDLWPMKRDRNLRIFQSQTVPQIVQTLLKEYGVNVETRLAGSYRVWEYCVQYQESSFDFISRLMELEGIYYFFRHEADKHTLVLCDAPDQHQPFPGYETITYHVTPSGGSVTEEGVSQWALSESVTPGMYSTDDYDFRKPNAWMLQARQNPVSPTPGSVDVYDWPGRFVEHGHGEYYARIRQEVWQVEHHMVSGSGTATGIAPGYTFALLNAPHFSDNGKYLVTSAHYDFEENSYASGDVGATRHNIDFTVLPAAVTYRAKPETPWPKTHGPQTAKVVGPKGESIWTDKYGRVKVKFHWDRLAKGDDTSSCWVRVSSAWAGQGFGGVQIPRVNDEVVVDFINGDPDRPLIIGRVYNEASMPPWALPAAATQMGFLSRSKDGTADTANALRFEDKAGEEHLWIQAQKNMDTNVKNDETHSVGGERSHYVAKNELHRVEANQSQAVKGGTEILTGQGKVDAVVEQYVLASGTQLRLVSGESAIELNANGTINLIGKDFNFFVENDGHITTGGKLNLNTSGAKPGTTAPGAGHKGDIDAAVQEKFTPGKPDTAGALASAPADASNNVANPTRVQTSSFSGYGKDVDNLVEKSPTMKQDITTLKKRGWVFKEGEAGKGTSADRQGRIITVDKSQMNNAAKVVQSLSHESGHALYKPNIDLSSKNSYLNSTLSDEGAATLNNIRVQREIIANQGGDIGIAGNAANQKDYNSIFDSLQKGDITESDARMKIGRIFGKGEQTSTTKEFYEDYYGGWYDKNYPSK
ncbi:MULTISPECIES: type VI secretion system Vgr family protein [Pantoea]|uniref:type VI secretion system Vgr family protein n=1 Tax=Pantoea TaxID=53335 RepID=UPI000496DD12|nr:MULTISPECIES: type VI secretion system tip protein TssI/VgrG [Pantoea]OWY76778.1 type IV secretion protein Rhs [Pantoea sp. AMG 501]PQK92128.1 type VI secretion system tip protein VgrG [Pantoea ananatis]PQL02567.1 type VI secretion system tip protein VgrG [Pantoea ananatis]PWV91073.1 type VI secretion system secreted protein VgrG [Pantoea ananatis]REC92049.1 type VI secretion system secreted protein VgrG [Pantoea ananatis]